MSREFKLDKKNSNLFNVNASDGTLIQFTDRNTPETITVDDETTEEVIHNIKVHYFNHSIHGTTGITDIMMILADQENVIIPNGVKLKNVIGDCISFQMIPKEKEVEVEPFLNIYSRIKFFIRLLYDSKSREPPRNHIKYTINKFFNYLN